MNAYKVFQKRRRLLRPKLVQKFAYNMMQKSGIDRDMPHITHISQQVKSIDKRMSQTQRIGR